MEAKALFPLGNLLLKNLGLSEGEAILGDMHTYVRVRWAPQDLAGSMGRAPDVLGLSTPQRFREVPPLTQSRTGHPAISAAKDKHC